ncbi:MAG: hypothetical protein GWP06_03655 [Actinobacteria bacterium]|nr:hypothetical protein [Actinomycetota bacterium]
MIKYLLLIFSLAGFILFFPMRFSNNDCCLGDVLSLFGNQHSMETTAHHNGDVGYLLHRYVFPFGLLWWTSIALGYWNLKQLIHQRTREKYEESAQ